MNLGSVYDTLTSIEKIANLTDKPVEQDGSVQLADTTNGLKVELKNLSFSYNNETDVLTNISFQVSPGEKICIKGKDSSGKSSLLKLMAGAYTDFKGALLLDDVPVGNYNLDSVRSQIGVLINTQEIFSGTLWENITLGSSTASMETVNYYANKVGLNDFIAAQKNGYDTILDPTGKRLPGSVIHKILLVRALAGKPRLLLLEDPWMNLEDGLRRQIIQLLNEIKNTTLVVVSNDEDFAKQCDKVLIMHEGRITAVTNTNSENQQ